MITSRISFLAYNKTLYSNSILFEYSLESDYKGSTQQTNN